MTLMQTPGPARPTGQTATVLPPGPPRQPAWVDLLRAACAAWVAAMIAVGAPAVLGFLAFVLIPTCTYSQASPPALLAAAAASLLLALVIPPVLAGWRLWWVGVPAAALALYGAWPSASRLLTETQSGFCF